MTYTFYVDIAFAQGDETMKIIIVEDDENIRDELCNFLKSYGYEVFALDKFDTVTEDILSSGGQLVLLDINLPMYDGYYICREIRKKSDIPIIIVTSRDSELDELMSMNLGADDFIAKPYNTQILLARISSLLKRAYKTSPAENLEFGGVTLNTSNGVITFKGKKSESGYHMKIKKHQHFRWCFHYFILQPRQVAHQRCLICHGCVIICSIGSKGKKTVL